MQFTLRKFFQPGHADSNKPALSPQESKGRGRPMSRHMEEIYREVFGKEAQKILAEQQQKQASLKRKADPANVDAPLREKSSSAIEEASMSTPRPPLKRLRTKGPGVFASPAESLSSGLGQSPPSSSDSLVRALSFELAGDKDDSEKDGSQQELDESGKNKFQLLAAAEAKRRGALGGRPSGKPGPGSRKIELPVAVRAKMASEMSKALSSFASEKDFWISMKRKYALSIPKLKSIFSDREALQSETQKKKLTTKPLLFQSGGKGTKKTAGSKRCRGFRKSGGGRKSRWPALLSELKAWVEEQRSYGHSVSKTTLMDRWIFLLSEKMLNLQAEAAAQVDASAKAETLQKAELAKSEKESLCKNYTARQSKCNRLMDSMGLKFMKPDLTTKLSAQEEAVRAMLTWQLWDRTLWKAFFSPLDVLGESVADPSAFRNNAESLVCIYSDQIPLWVKASSERALEVCCMLRHEGPKSRGSLKVSVLNLKGLLRLWCSQMKTEQEKCEKALDLRIEKLESERETLRNQALKMAEAVTKAKEAKSDAEALADKVFNQGKSPEYNDLPQSAKDAIDKIELMGNIKVCSRCRYSSGCLSCDKDKALRYHLNVLRHSLGMKPLACPGLSSSLLPLPLWCVSHVLCHTDPAAAPALPVCLLLVVVFGGFKVLCHTDPAAAPALPVCLLHVVLIIAQHSVLIIAQHSDAFCACVF